MSLLALVCTGSAKAQKSGAGSISHKEIEAHLQVLAAPEMEGRDTPSTGQDKAEEYIARHFAEWGLTVWSEAQTGSPKSQRGTNVDAGSENDWEAYLWPWQQQTELPDASKTRLNLELSGAPEFQLGRDFQPMLEFGGQAAGQLVFLGYGLKSKGDRYDDFKGAKCEGKIGVILEGEPPHKKKLDGPDLSPKASLFDKLEDLTDAGLSGVLVIRKEIEQQDSNAKDAAEEGDSEDFGFRYGWARWQGTDNDRLPPKKQRIPMLELSGPGADKLMGPEWRSWKQSIDKRFRPASRELDDLNVDFRSSTKWVNFELHNVLGVVPGSDPALRKEYVVLGAHHDHVGVDSRGRIGFGADDNASGTSAALEVAQALMKDPPARSVLICTFSAEEDGLLGSKALCAKLPIPAEQIVGMVNMDMIGRGKRNEVVVFGAPKSPEMRKIVERAKKLTKTGIKKIEFTKDVTNLFLRSDHFPFHEIGIPTAFFFEGLPLSNNPDYHTWRDTIDALDFQKIASTAKLAYNTVWLLGSDPDRPGPPKR